MTENQDTLLDELHVHADDPDQAELIGFHIAVREAQLDVLTQVPPRPEALAPGEGFANGVPLLPVDRLRIEPTLFTQAFERIAGLVAERRPQWAIPADVPHMALLG